MKILFALSSLHAGGAERVAATLTNAWVERGDEVTLVATFSGRGTCFYPISEKARIVFLADLVASTRRYFINRLQRLVALRRLLMSERPNVVVSFLPDVNVASVIASLGLRIPVIICERTDPLVSQKTKFLQLSTYFAYHHARMLSVQTQAVATRMHSAFPRLKQLRVVPNPIPEELQKHPLSLPPRERRRLVAAGRLTEDKQFDLLIAVFSTLAPQWHKWDLVIYGEGQLHPQLERQIQTLGMTGRVTLAGVRKTLWEEMARSDVFVMTSRLEGFPNVLLEAMALGLPCVVFDCPSGPNEITCNGEDAMLVTLNDLQGLTAALATVMGDAPLRIALGSRARESVVRRFSLATVLNKWDELFKEIGAIA
jgi:glycosyltransferase involved in cell wall biosynthesis